MRVDEGRCFVTTPILGQRHLTRSLPYVLRQDDHHGTHIDVFHDGSSLPDLLGLRVVCPSIGATVREFLPRVTRADLLQILGVDLADADVCFDHLAEAAAAALALPNLDDRSADAVAARRAAVHVALTARVPARRIATLLCVSAASISRLRSEPPQANLVRAVGLQLRLRTATSRGGVAKGTLEVRLSP